MSRDSPRSRHRLTPLVGDISSNPIGAQLTANLTDEQAAAVRQVLDGMLLERSGGESGAVLHTETNIGLGTT